MINISLSTQKKSDKLDTLITKALEKNIVIIASYDNVEGHINYPAKYAGVIGVKQAEKNYAIVKNNNVFLPITKQFKTMTGHTEELVHGNSFATAFVTGSIVRIKENVMKKIISLVLITVMLFTFTTAPCLAIEADSSMIGSDAEYVNVNRYDTTSQCRKRENIPN